jgi:hypothetical protein
MDNIERRLIELNQSLLKLSTERMHPDKELLEQAIRVLSGATINTGSGNDTVIVNNPEFDCNTCPPGATGPSGATGATGSEGQPGATGASGKCDCKCNTITISEDYIAKNTDCYIGVNSVGPVTIILPSDSEDGHELIIKAEMGPPLGNRKITILPVNDANSNVSIDGDDEYVIEVPYGSVSLIYNNNNWWIV